MSSGESGAVDCQASRNPYLSGGAWRGYLKILSLAALLLVEVLALSLRFDGKTIATGASSNSAATGQATAATGADPIETRAQWSSWFVAHSNMVPGLGATALLAALLFGGRRSLEELERLPWRWSWPAFVGHLAALAVFAWVTGQVFEGAVLSSTWGLAWLIAWVALGLTVAILLIATAIPPGVWGPLAIRGFPAAGVGVVVAIAAAGAGQLTSLLWRPLAHGTLGCVHTLLGLVSTNPVYEPSHFVVGTDSFAVEIASQCSGYEGIGLVWAFLGAYIWFFRRQLRFPQAWLLLPLGAGVIWLANVVRIFALVMVGTWISADVAAGGFHSEAGWMAFIAVSLGLMLLAHRSPFFRRVDAPWTERTAGPSREAVYLAPLLAIVGVAMISGAFSAGGLDRYYPVRLVAVVIPLWLYRREYAAMRWSCSWQALAIGVLVLGIWVARRPGVMSGLPTHWAPAVNPMTAWTYIWLLARVIGSVVTVPLAEELAFRGFLTRRLISANFDTVPPGRFTWTSFAVSSLAFGVLHDRWLEGTMAGMLYALAYYRRGSLGDAVAAHATTNALLSADALITGDWSLFS